MTGRIVRTVQQIKLERTASLFMAWAIRLSGKDCLPSGMGKTKRTILYGY
jgi:hypothetical protein